MSRRRKTATVFAAVLCVIAVAVLFAAPAGFLRGSLPGEAGGSSAMTSAESPGDGSNAETPSASDNSSREPYEPHALLVKLANGADATALKNELASLPGLSGASVASQVTDSIVKLALPDALPVEDAAKLVGSASTVSIAEPNYYLQIQETPPTAQREAAAQAATAQLEQEAVNASAGLIAGTPLGNALGVQAAVSEPNDPLYSQQWSLPSVNALQAWANATEGAAASNPAVTVAAIDAGFLTTHEDLQGNIAATYSAVNDRETNSLATTVPKGVEHGTHVAGIIAARTNNGKGVAGSTYNTAKVLPIAIAETSGAIGVASLVRAYSYIEAHQTEHNIRIANLSIGTGKTSLVKRTDSDFRLLYEAIEEARSQYGITTVVAACNTDSDSQMFKTAPFYAVPSDYDNVISVINIDKNLDRLGSSNYNKGDQIAKNLSAPGTTIRSLIASDTSAYGDLSGTSMSAPLVSGVAALMLKVTPSMSPAEVTSKLYSSARDLTTGADKAQGWDAATGFGEVDAAAATDPSTPYLSGDPLFHDGNGFSHRQFSVKENGVQQQASSYQWSSSNPEVATVSQDGVVMAVADGRTIISAEKDGAKAVQVVTVDGWPTYTMSGPSEIDWNTQAGSAAFTVRVNGAADAATNWTWASSDENVAAVSSAGVVTGFANGTVTITATRKAGDEVLSQQVTVKVPALTGASTVQVGSSTALALKDGATALSASGAAFSSSNAAVAAVDSSGVVTGKAVGRATITARIGAVTAQKTLTVTQPPAPPSPSTSTSSSASSSASSSSSSSTTSTATATTSTSTTASATTSTSATRSSSTITSTTSSSSATSSSSSSTSSSLRSIENYKVTLSATRLVYTGSSNVPAVSVWPALRVTDFTVAYLDSAGNKVTPRSVGTYRVVLIGKEDKGYTGTASAAFSIVKAANPMTAKLTTSKKVVRASTVKKKQKAYKLISVKNAQGKVRYQKARGSKLGLKTNGQIIVRKAMRKGTYKIKVNVLAAGNSSYLPATKTLTAKVRVK